MSSGTLHHTEFFFLPPPILCNLATGAYTSLLHLGYAHHSKMFQTMIFVTKFNIFQDVIVGSKAFFPIFASCR